MVGSPDPVLYFLSATAALKFLLSYLNYRSVPKEAKRVGKISRITLFPLKSARGIDLNAAECTFSGLKMTEQNIYDRHWLVIREDNNRFLTGRQAPKMTTIQPSFHGDCLQLDAPGMDPMKIPHNISATPSNIVDAIVWGESIQGVDCGQAAADWLNKLLSPSRCRLIYCASGIQLRSLAARKDDQWYVTAKDVDEVAYQDAAPFMLISEASLADVNKRLPGGVDKVAMDQFRPNFVASGCEAFDEDSWKEVYIGGVKYTNIKKCDRCILTIVNPQTGTKHPDMEPLKTLRSYRLLVPEFEQAPCFGVNFVADWTGDIHLGDEILATK